MSVIQVVLVDDHTLVRHGIRALLAEIAGVVVIGEAGDGGAALDLIAALRPDVVLLDIGLPGINGLEVAARLAHDSAAIRVIMLSMQTGEDYVWQALRAGARGYLLKAADVAELELALRAVMRGQIYLSPAVSGTVVAGYLERSTLTPTGIDRLTARQREVLQLIAAGHTTKAIATHLHISVKTVETHRAQLMEQLDIHDLASLVRYAIRTGLVSSDS